MITFTATRTSDIVVQDGTTTVGHIVPCDAGYRGTLADYNDVRMFVEGDLEAVKSALTEILELPAVDWERFWAIKQAVAAKDAPAPIVVPPITSRLPEGRTLRFGLIRFVPEILANGLSGFRVVKGADSYGFARFDTCQDKWLSYLTEAAIINGQPDTEARRPKDVATEIVWLVNFRNKRAA